MKATHVVWSLVVALVVCSASLAAEVKIADGTPIILVMTQSITSGGPRVGDKLPLRVRDTVFGPQGEILVMNGAPASATITASKKSKFLGREGALDFKVDEVTAADGTRLLVRSLQRHSGESRKAGSRIASMLFLPFAAIKGTNVTIPAGFQFPTYVDGDYTVRAARAEGAPKPLILGTARNILESNDYLQSAVMLTNPNQDYCVVNGALLVTAYDAAQRAIGTTLSLNPANSQQLYSLRPGETRTFVKRLKLDGGFASAKIEEGQPWQKWDPATNRIVDVNLLFSEWASPSSIKGMLRNDTQNTIDGTEVTVTIRRGDDLAAFGVVRFDRIRPGATQPFTVNLIGLARAAEKYEITAVGQIAPVQ